MPEIKGVVNIVNGIFYNLSYRFDPETGSCEFYKAVAVTKERCGDSEFSEEFVTWLKKIIMLEVYKNLNAN